MNLLPNPKPISLLASLRKTAIMLVASGGILAAAGQVYSMQPVTTTWAAPESGHTASADLPPAKGTQAWVIKKAGCKPATGGVLPTSVVVDPAGPRSWTHVTSDEGIGHAFEQEVFNGTIPANEWTLPVDHGMRVGVFCR